MYRVQVLMSVYNGSKYLQEQLDSIFRQKGIRVSLLVRDDGSQDNSVELLYAYKEKNSFDICIVEGRNIGIKRSFLSLIEMADRTCDFYAFADQDDIWEEEKLQAAVRVLYSADFEDKPSIYASSVKVFVKNEIRGIAFENASGKSYQFKDFLLKNYFPGCTMVFNKRLLELLVKHDLSVLNEYPLHDLWLNLVCTGCGGKVFFDNVSYILYRQHEHNAVGVRQNFASKIKESAIFDKHNLRSGAALELLKLYDGELSDEAMKLIEKIKKADDSFTGRLGLVLDQTLRPEKRGEAFLFGVLVMLGRF